MLIYVNAYAVTRHYGGPEEGGWYYNAGEPIASIPFTALERLEACPSPDNCQCRWNGNGIVTHDEHPNWQEADPEQGIGEPPPHAHYKIDSDRVKATIDKLKEDLGDTNEGNIYSVRGGVELQVRVEDHFAMYWPEQRPHYE